MSWEFLPTEIATLTFTNTFSPKSLSFYLHVPVALLNDKNGLNFGRKKSSSAVGISLLRH